MTQSEIETLVNAAMQKHVLATYWSGVDASVKSSAVSMATIDCTTYIGWNLDDILPTYYLLDTLVSAIAEQSVFILRHYEDNEGGKVVASESAGGVSQTYAVANGGADGGMWSARAKAIMETLRKRKGGSVRIFRG